MCIRFLYKQLIRDLGLEVYLLIQLCVTQDKDGGIMIGLAANSIIKRAAVHAPLCMLQGQKNPGITYFLRKSVHAL